MFPVRALLPSQSITIAIPKNTEDVRWGRPRGALLPEGALSLHGDVRGIWAPQITNLLDCRFARLYLILSCSGYAP